MVHIPDIPRDGEEYSGDYHGYSSVTGRVSGNPARAKNVKEILKTIKNKDHTNGDQRNHAEAISIEDMGRIMRWSEQICPNELLERTWGNADQFIFVATHGMLRAFCSSAFTLWARCSCGASPLSLFSLPAIYRSYELYGLKAGDISWECEGPAPYFVRHFKVRLHNRKGWQNKVAGTSSGMRDGPLEGEVAAHAHHLLCS